jgi:hypothetical protein
MLPNPPFVIPQFLERLSQGSNVVQEVDVSVVPGATLLFGRHVEALLRQFANHDRSSWDERQGEYWTVFNCNPDEARKRLGVFVGWIMKSDAAIERVWIAAGGEDILWSSDLIRPPRPGEPDEVLYRLRTLVLRASQKANQGALISFDAVTRIDANQPILPLRPMKLGELLLASVPPATDAERLGWGHNPGLALLTKVLAADAKDAEQAAGRNVFEFLLFWTLVSGSYCHPTKLLSSSTSDDQAAQARMTEISMPEADVEKFHPYTRFDSQAALQMAEPLWQQLQAIPAQRKTKVLSSMAAYRAALGVQRGTRSVPTLAVVAYIAALESLLRPSSQCEGHITCNKCGALPWRHEQAGHLRNILQSVLPTVSEELRPRAKAMLKRAYQKLRSAYVHSAQTEWREFAGAYLWQDITDPDEFWREERPFLTLFKLDEIVRNFIVLKINRAENEPPAADGR